MRSIFDVKIDRLGYHGIEIHHEDLLKSKDGVDNPFAYNLALDSILRCLIRMQFGEEDRFAVDMLKALDKRREDLEFKLNITADKYGIQD